MRELEREQKIRCRLRAIGFTVLCTGLVAAIVVFFHPPPELARNPIGFEEMGGRLIPIYKESSKRYQQAAQSFLGGGGMLLTDVREGFVNLWHGRRLAYTIAVLSILVSYGFFYFSDLFGYPPGETEKSSAPR